MCQISVHYPNHRLLHSFFKLILNPLSHIPLNAITFFTDGSGNSLKSVIAWQNPDTKEWEFDTEEVEDSPQVMCQTIAFS